MPKPSHQPAPSLHPVTGEPMAPVPPVKKNVIKKDGSGAYVTRETKKKAKKPMSAAEIREEQASMDRAVAKGRVVAATPLKLTYVWEGTCPTCNTPVKTLALDIARRYVAIAYCPQCGKNVTERIVRRLEELEIEDEPKKSKKDKKAS